MKFPNSPALLAIFSFLSFSISWTSSSDPALVNGFLQCLPNQSHSSTHPITEAIYTSQNASFQSLLLARSKNRRFSTPKTPKPLAIIAAKHKYHVQATVVCAKQYNLQIRIRSGGHDYEGLSYVSEVPFVVLDMFNLDSVDINVEDKSAWVGSGATLGKIYYEIAAKTNVYGFPAGVGPTVGAGGHFTGGGYGNMMRQYGLSIDNIVDAKVVNVKGTIHDRKSMGEDFFWAIKGGGAASFGVILSWKIKLVPVPTKVTGFNVTRTLDQGATNLLFKWQYVAPNVPKNLFIRARPRVRTLNGKNIVDVTFIGLFLGQSDNLLPLMKKSFPELGLSKNDFYEISWIESVVVWAEYSLGTPVSILVNTPNEEPSFFKAKSDLVKQPIPIHVLESIWKMIVVIDDFWMEWNPYGGRMAEIPESETPYPHRGGNLYMIQYYASWLKEGVEATDKYLHLIRKLSKMMTPFVSKNPREAFQNYRDLDIGANLSNQTDFRIARAYGSRYFKGNFGRLVHVKTMVDPQNFFKHEQSIPPI